MLRILFAAVVSTAEDLEVALCVCATACLGYDVVNGQVDRGPADSAPRLAADGGGRGLLPLVAVPSCCPVASALVVGGEAFGLAGGAACAVVGELSAGEAGGGGGHYPVVPSR